MEFLTVKKVAQLFNRPDFIKSVDYLEENAKIPKRQLFRSGALFQKGWNLDQLPAIGAEIGIFKKLAEPKVVTVFTTKGGVLKSTLTLNMARMAAMSNLKTLVIGLDIQGDISNLLCDDLNVDDSNIDDALSLINSIHGLSSYFNGQKDLAEIIQTTNLPNLFCIPETPELAALNESLSNINRREYWLNDKVVSKLKSIFDLIIFDCSPNWNKLTTNALVASDLLVSPLECKINNFRNFKVFKKFIGEFKEEMSLKFETIYIPTKYAENKKLSKDIKTWYQTNLSNCINFGIPESVIGEEACALKLSLLEHQPQNKVSEELANVLREISKQLVILDTKELNLENYNQPLNARMQEQLWP